MTAEELAPYLDLETADKMVLVEKNSYIDIKASSFS